MATSLVGTASQIAQAYKERDVETGALNVYLNALTGSYAEGVAEVQQKTSYDISRAYENYKKSQISLMTSSRLGTGFKEMVSRDLIGAFGEQYKDITAQETEKLSELETSYTTAKEKVESALSKSYQTQGEKSKELLSSAIAFLGQTEKYSGLTEEQFAKVAYDTTIDPETLTSTRQLNQYGADMLQYALLGATVTSGEDNLYFSDWLASQEDNEELVDWYSQNSEAFKQVILGMSAGDIEWSEEDLSRLSKSKQTVEAKQAFDARRKEFKVSADAPEDSGLVAMSDAEDLSVGKVITDTFGNSYKVSDLYAMRRKIGGTRGSHIVVDKMNDELNYAFSNRKDGDIVQYDNRKYLYKSRVWYLLEETSTK